MVFLRYLNRIILSKRSTQRSSHLLGLVEKLINIQLFTVDSIKSAITLGNLKHIQSEKVIISEDDLSVYITEEAFADPGRDIQICSKLADILGLDMSTLVSFVALRASEVGEMLRIQNIPELRDGLRRHVHLRNVDAGMHAQAHVPQDGYSRADQMPAKHPYNLAGAASGVGVNDYGSRSFNRVTDSPFGSDNQTARAGSVSSATASSRHAKTLSTPSPTPSGGDSDTDSDSDTPSGRDSDADSDSEMECLQAPMAGLSIGPQTVIKEGGENSSTPNKTSEGTNISSGADDRDVTTSYIESAFTRVNNIHGRAVNSPPRMSHGNSPRARPRISSYQQENGRRGEHFVSAELRTSS